MCWNAIVEMVREAELPVSAFAAMLAGAMRSEPSPPVLSALQEQAEWLIARFATPGQAAEARTRLDLAAAAIPGLTPDAEARWTALRRLAAAGRETVTAVAGGFLQPEHATLLAPYADRYLSQMPGLWRTRDGHMRVP